MKVEKNYGYLVVDGKYYTADQKDGHTIFKQIPKRQFKERCKTIDKLAKKLKDSLDREKVLKESLHRLTPKDLALLDKMLFKSKKKYKPKTRKHHCVDLKIGNFILPVVD